MIELLARAIDFILPAYIANATPVIAGGGPPIDFNKKFLDGEPILGSHKTIRGFAAGLAAGLIVALIFGKALALGLALSLGALLGDLAGSFLKRRLKIPPGASLPGVDQLDFLVGALALACVVTSVALETVLVLMLITPPLHVGMNAFARALGLGS